MAANTRTLNERDLAHLMGWRDEVLIQMHLLCSKRCVLWLHSVQAYD